MVDITKCTGGGDSRWSTHGGLVICPKRDGCYRFIVAAGEKNQAWMDAPFDLKIRKCDYFLPIKREEEK